VSPATPACSNVAGARWMASSSRLEAGEAAGRRRRSPSISVGCWPICPPSMRRASPRCSSSSVRSWPEWTHRGRWAVAWELSLNDRMVPRPPRSSLTRKRSRRQQRPATCEFRVTREQVAGFFVERLPPRPGGRGTTAVPALRWATRPPKGHACPRLKLIELLATTVT